ncbi:MAG: Flp pilus assembly complex ATPase component TadA, partial [Holosporales bacterium]|nr:Flp pilus assembly complex ATPase component TadA [Holosporales bacterium]
MSFLDFLIKNKVIERNTYEILSKGDIDIDSYLANIVSLSEDEIIALKSECFGLEIADLENFFEIRGINYSILKEYSALPFNSFDDCIHVAISDPDNVDLKDKVEYYIAAYKKVNVKYYLAKNSDIQHKFDEIDKSKEKRIDKLIFSALKERASDIHITPYEKTCKIMFRVDGDLRHFEVLSIEEFESLAISIKVSAKLDISEVRRAQSGHFQIDATDLRVSTHPTIYGENIVIRILNKKKSFIEIDKLGFSDDQIKYMKDISRLSNGVIIFSGPTGSGKTTSIYALLETMDRCSRNIMTLEDPVEYKIQNIRQTEIKPGVINFADGVRSILRQDPDIILIGEIRDKETAEMAIRASMTGHLVLTTIHANDSFGIISRFQEFGISLSLIVANIIA